MRIGAELEGAATEASPFARILSPSPSLDLAGCSWQGLIPGQKGVLRAQAVAGARLDCPAPRLETKVEAAATPEDGSGDGVQPESDSVLI